MVYEVQFGVKFTWCQFMGVVGIVGETGFFFFFPEGAIGI